MSWASTLQQTTAGSAVPLGPLDTIRSARVTSASRPTRSTSSRHRTRNLNPNRNHCCHHPHRSTAGQLPRFIFDWYALTVCARLRPSVLRSQSWPPWWSPCTERWLRRASRPGGVLSKAHTTTQRSEISDRTGHKERYHSSSPSAALSSYVAAGGYCAQRARLPAADSLQIRLARDVDVNATWCLCLDGPV